MPDPLVSLLAQEGLAWIMAAALVAGVVRGFSGFGTALIYLPVAAKFLDPFVAIATLALMDLLGPLPNLRGALRGADRRDLARLLMGLLIGLPIGLWVLSFVPPEVFRNVVSTLALAMLAVLVLGVRYRGAIRPAMVAGIGGASGFLGGVSGLPGPPVILFYMARPLSAEVIRATILLHLFAFDLSLTALLAALGRLETGPLLLGLALAVPNLLGNWIGGRVFAPGHERLYRGVAYGLIGIAALSGLLL